MAVFHYRALDSKGRPTKGVVDADNIRLARQKLRGQGIFPTGIEEADNAAPKSHTGLRALVARERSVSTTELAVTTRQLATLAGAGMPLVEALRALGEQVDDAGLRRVIAEVGEKVNAGATLASSLKDYPRVFPRLYSNMVAAGEASGSLELVLTRLADLLESQANLKRKINSALTYPTLMLVLCFGVVVLLLTYVVPQITAIFESQKRELPLPTQIIVVLSNIVREYFVALFALVLGTVLGWRFYSRSERGRRQIDKITLRLPFVGKLAIKIATGRLARNLGTMLESGIELLNALAITKNIVGNLIVEEAVDQAIIGVREGGSLSIQLEKSHIFPRILIHMVAIGEKTGQLEEMLLRAASAFEGEVEAVISRLTSILEPVMILFLAVVVGGIVAAVMLPMLDMTSMIAN